MPIDTLVLYIAFVAMIFAAIQGVIYFSADVRAETQDRWSSIRRPTLADGVSPWLRDILLSEPIRRFDNLVSTCGIKVRTENVLLGIMVLTIVLMVMFDYILPLNSIFGLILACTVGIGLPIILLVFVRDRRMAKLAAQLPETLDTMVRSLKAGHPIPVAIGLIAEEMADPVGSEFQQARETMAFGLDLRGALARMSERLHTVPELRSIVSAIRIQSVSGGNLAEVLGSLSKLMREQHKLKMKIKAISAEGRLSGNILAAIPVFLFIAVNVINPDYFSGFRDNPALMYGLLAAAFLCVLGVIMIRRISTIRV